MAPAKARTERDDDDVAAMKAMELGRISAALLSHGWELHYAKPREGRLELVDPAFPDVVFALDVT